MNRWRNWSEWQRSLSFRAAVGNEGPLQTPTLRSGGNFLRHRAAGGMAYRRAGIVLPAGGHGNQSFRRAGARPAVGCSLRHNLRTLFSVENYSHRPRTGCLDAIYSFPHLALAGPRVTGDAAAR